MTQLEQLNESLNLVLNIPNLLFLFIVFKTCRGMS